MGTLTITTDAGQDTRLQAAFGDRLGTVDGNGDPRVATGAEIRAEVVNLLKKIVRNHERDEVEETARGTLTDLGTVT